MELVLGELLLPDLYDDNCHPVAPSEFLSTGLTINKRFFFTRVSKVVLTGKNKFNRVYGYCLYFSNLSLGVRIIDAPLIRIVPKQGITIKSFSLNPYKYIADSTLPTLKLKQSI